MKTLTLTRRALALLVLALLAPLPVSLALSSHGVGAFRLQFDQEIFDAPFTGELFVAFAEAGQSGEPRQAMHGWFGAPPVLRFEIQGARGEVLVSQAGLSTEARWLDVDELFSLSLLSPA